ncbi:MAG: RDD family protein [Kiritimatiellae bacterium]|nr:RDD family protein [Kiritimatiellia bacterium]
MRFEKKLTIRIPEGVEFSMPVADPLVRGMALLVDFAFKIMASTLLSVIFFFVTGLFGDLALSLWMICSFLVTLFYPVFFEWHWRGQTPGKRIFKLRVVDSRGLNLNFSQILIRNLLRLVDMLPAAYVCGGTVALCSRLGQRLGDIAAGTVVVSARTVVIPDLDALRPTQYNSLRDYAHLTARVRQLTSPEEALLIANAILRREQLEPTARLSVFRALRIHFEQKAGYPEKITAGMSDEQYLRNIADALFCSKS